MTGERVAIEDGAPVLTAAQMARALGITEEALRAELHAGRILSVVERGEGTDAGRLRGRLRWRSLEVVFVLDADGTVLAMTRTGDWRC
jgi:prophage antirepressor-like protein